jgi:CRISPR/Cas system-associated protein endoribonuclease Cas2
MQVAIKNHQIIHQLLIRMKAIKSRSSYRHCRSRGGLEKFNDQLPTSQGLLSLKKIGKEDFERPDLYLGDKIILAQDVNDDRISLVRRFKLTQGEAILVSTDAGGSGTLPSYAILLLLKGQAPKWLNKDDFYSETGDITYAQKGDVVTIGLGINDKGLNKSIVFRKWAVINQLIRDSQRWTF